MKKDKYNLPELICIRNPHKGCNDGYYEVRIPVECIPHGQTFVGLWQIYRFIGLKVNKGKG